MTQTTAMFIAFILYGVLPMAGVFLGYKGFKKLTQPKMLEYHAMPKLGYIPEKSLPSDVKMTLDAINAKGERLKLLYGDTNNDGKIDDHDAVTESYVMIKKLLEEHIPQVVSDYRRLNELGDDRAKTITIAQSGITGKQALLDVLNTINAQFDNMTDAIYHQDGQKLLIANRYLKSRFDEAQR